MLPPYLAGRLEALRRRFGDGAFTTEDACRALSISKPLVHTVLHELSRRGSIRRVGKGVYVLASGGRVEPSMGLPGAVEKIGSILRSQGLRFLITGLDLLLPFVHHLPVRYPHLVCVNRGSGEWAKDELLKSGFKALLEPRRGEIALGLDLAAGSELAIIRETSNFYAVEGEVASLERALIDLYFEATRGDYPVPVGEVGRILYNALKGATINYSRLLRCARRRRIEAEVRTILKGLSRYIPVPDHFLAGRMEENEHTETVRGALEAMAR